MLNIGIAGCAGRMGKELLNAAIADSHYHLAAGLVQAGHPHEGNDLALICGHHTPFSIVATSDIAHFIGACDIIIDFTTPLLTVQLAQQCATQHTALITGTTGLDAAQQQTLEQAARVTPILQSFNMSLSVNLMANLLEQAAATLHDQFDIEILEIHHKHKVDAPSGTALMLGEAAAKGRGVVLDEVKQTVRDGQTGPRKQGDIGFAVLRAGGVIGEHRVMLANEHERLELTHISQSRSIYAQGAMTAAGWLSQQSPALYSMRDMLPPIGA